MKDTTRRTFEKTGSHTCPRVHFQISVSYVLASHRHVTAVMGHEGNIKWF